MLDELIKSGYIAIKDFREYYLKPGSLSWGIIFPFVFALAFMTRRGGLTEWLAPGMISLALFFGSTSMSAMSIVFERRIGSFERLLLFPVGYNCISLGKSLSSFIMGIISVIPVLLLTLIILPQPPAFILLLIITIIITTFASSTFGVLLSFMVKDPTQVMSVFNIVRFTMMFLSGIIIPITALPHYVIPISLALPLTYMTEALRYAYIGSYDILPPEISITVSLILSILFLVGASEVIKRSKP
ncbi:MAG: ABC transporter permease [Desulfurococcales archaeon]|nr:ABC transporter permease [Desulfurococcales archaeon]